MSDEDRTGKPPAAVMKETLERMEETLLTLGKEYRDFVSTSHTDAEALGTLLGDCRDTITEAVGVMHSQTSDLLQAMDVVQQQMGAAGAPQPWPWRTWLAAAGIGVLVASAGAWGLWPDSRYWHLAVGIDRVLAQQYGGLSKGLQEQLNAVYAGVGIQAPGQRQKSAAR